MREDSKMMSEFCGCQCEQGNRCWVCIWCVLRRLSEAVGIWTGFPGRVTVTEQGTVQSLGCSVSTRPIERMPVGSSAVQVVFSQLSPSTGNEEDHLDRTPLSCHGVFLLEFYKKSESLASYKVMFFKDLVN